ncbi:MAG: DUF302 domain-containing protein [Sulfuriferula sp.]
MKYLFAIGLLVIFSSSASACNPGLVSHKSPYSVTATMDRLSAILQAKGIKIFARIDDSKEARTVGLSLRPTQLLIFGNPKFGTPLMQKIPSIALDLPLKVLVWQDTHGQVWVTWDSPDYLIQRYGLEDSYKNGFAIVGKLVGSALR